MPLTPGQILNNRYRIDALLGQGGFGAVYRAFDLNLKVYCAVKENLDTTEIAQRQFEHEASILASLRHPSLPRVTDHFFMPGQGQYLVMDFIEGDNLDEILNKVGAPVRSSQALNWIGQICSALTYLHSQLPPIIHRDVKPANIKITPDGRAMLVDFGIAKIYDPHLKTTAGARAITPGFSPPEQYGFGKTDPRSDIYALGATLYKALTRRDPPESVELAIGVPLVNPRTINPDISPQLEAVILQAMQPTPTHRFQSAAALKTALQGTGAVLSSPSGVVTVLPSTSAIAVHGSAAGPRSGLPPWLWIGLAGLLGLGLVVIVGLGLLLANSNGQSGNRTAAAVYIAETRTAEHRIDRITATSNLGEASATLDVTHPVPPSATATSTHTQIPATPTITPTERHIDDISGLPMVLIPAGTFQMGADADAAYSECLSLCLGCACTHIEFEDEEPVHSVYVNSFYIDVYEVTNSAYAAFLNANGNQSEGGVTWFDSSSPFVLLHQSGGTWSADAGYGQHPVIRVSWFGAQAYCAWRGGRLPTEAEWERAARGGEDGRFYIWGNSFDDSLGNFCDSSCTFSWANHNYDDGFSITAPVGSFPSNGYGLYDMAGNLWEWTQDYHSFDYYTTSPSDNPTGPASGDRYTVRGGCYQNAGDYLRPAIRFPIPPDSPRDSVGFRCVILP